MERKQSKKTKRKYIEKLIETLTEKELKLERDTNLS
jgi:hypothetical protein